MPGRGLRGLATTGRQPARWSEAVTLHSLAWLAIGNLVGLLLATLLLFPGLGGVLSPLTYGRWMPLHLNAQLYGWCGLPLVGLLFRLYLRRDWHQRAAVAVLGAWSGSLLLGCFSWLSGSNSGKPFLDWIGPSAVIFAAGMATLSLLLLVAYLGDAATAPRRSRSDRLRLLAKGVLLVFLVPIPLVIYRVARPDVYPPFNPDSGGATGGSLLGSTLAVVTILLITPAVMRLERRSAGPKIGLLLTLLGLHFGWFLLLDHGNRSHHELVQILSLASLAIWPPLLWRFFRAHHWPAESRRWLGALGAWGTALVITGLVTFLPGVLELEKFTNALVAHAHLAMAGMATSFCMLILIGLDPKERYVAALGARRPFVLWQVGCVVHVVSLLILGGLEATDAGLLFQADRVSQMLYLGRWSGGLLMLLASAEWLARAARPQLSPRIAARLSAAGWAR